MAGAVAAGAGIGAPVTAGAVVTGALVIGVVVGVVAGGAVVVGDTVADVAGAVLAVVSASSVVHSGQRDREQRDDRGRVTAAGCSEPRVPNVRHHPGARRSGSIGGARRPSSDRTTASAE